MNKVAQIMKDAGLIGACSKSGKVTDYKSLVWMFFSPQGREFCEQNNYPSLPMFRRIREEVLEFGVLVDRGIIERNNDENIALIGNTEATLVYTDNTKVHKVILMHGAKAKIKASNYAVILLVNMGACQVEIEKDATVAIL